MDASTIVEQLQASQPISEQSGLDQRFIARIQDAFSRPGLASSLGRKHPIIAWFSRLAEQPTKFAAITTLFAALLWMACVFAHKQWSGVAVIAGWVINLSAMLLTIVHLIYYAIKGQTRVALFGFVGFLSVTMVYGITISLISEGLKFNQSTGLPSVVMQAIAYMMLGLGYLFVAISVSIFSSYIQVERQEVLLRKRGRQKLLEELFAIRKRIRQAESASSGDIVSRWPKWIDTLRSRLYWIALGIGIAIELVHVASSRIFDPKGNNLNPTTFSLGFMIGQIVTLVLWVLIIVSLGFLARKLWRAILVVTLFVAGTLIIAFSPVGVREAPGDFWMTVAFQYVLALFIGMAGAVGSQIEETAFKKRLVAENDLTALRTAQSELELLLRPRSTVVYILAIDASKSSVMKAQADPFEAEWSFREYQDLLAEIATRCLGSVYATAGDGAIVAFNSARNAVEAAIQVQAEIAVFNARRNMLALPFKIRCGVHCGQIEGVLGQVQYTAVIDIAAHVEGCAPVGGVAVTQPIMDECPDLAVYETERVTDGYRVFVVAGVRGPSDGV